MKTTNLDKVNELKEIVKVGTQIQFRTGVIYTICRVTETRIYYKINTYKSTSGNRMNMGWISFRQLERGIKTGEVTNI